MYQLECCIPGGEQNRRGPSSYEVNNLATDADVKTYILWSILLGRKAWKSQQEGGERGKLHATWGEAEPGGWRGRKPPAGWRERAARAGVRFTPEAGVPPPDRVGEGRPSPHTYLPAPSPPTLPQRPDSGRTARPWARLPRRPLQRLPRSLSKIAGSLASGIQNFWQPSYSTYRPLSVAHAHTASDAWKPIAIAGPRRACATCASQATQRPAEPEHGFTAEGFARPLVTSLEAEARPPLSLVHLIGVMGVAWRFEGSVVCIYSPEKKIPLV